ncbi:alpha/beta hydrolase [Actinoallomurus acaciae]|uniref:Alpha/beta hydrolase n=1 Tax=Actinoallomurus acaciae TaxID=502577 RepID=A0ABV5YRM8_9ACTN
MIKRLTVIATVLAVGLQFLPAAQAGAEPTGGTGDTIAARDGCERTTSTVRLTATDATPYRIAGWMCGPRAPHDGEVQFLLHGFTYNHLYWMGLGVDRLDYVRAAARQGRTTFVIDQLGAGASDHPDPTGVTSGDLAYVAHQLVGRLRSGQIGRAHTHFQRVIGVGHSMGAGIALLEAGTYHDVNAVVLADELHATNAEGVNTLNSHVIPANTLSRFASLPDGYLTVEPRSLFYDTGLADPSVIDLDEQIGIDTTGAFTPTPDPGDPAFSDAITVPVLIVVGRQDSLDCGEATGLSCANAGAVMDRESSLYSGASCMDAFVLDSGHDTNLHNAAPQWFAYAGDWVDAVDHGQPSAQTRSCLPG